MSGLNRTPGKRVYAAKRTAGSNPALSARYFYKTISYISFTRFHCQFDCQNGF